VNRSFDVKGMTVKGPTGVAWRCPGLWAERAVMAWLPDERIFGLAVLFNN
jgi:hypothetical protein